MTLNEEQQIAKDYLINFVNGGFGTEDDYYATLSGFAGTGKTTTINEILRGLTNKRVVVSAPTHAAKEVICSMTKKVAETIQALLGLRPDIDMSDFDPNKPIFKPIAEEKIQYYQVVIIDECSMLNKEAFKLIEEKAKEHKVKIIYIGDEYQLPPVGEVKSKTFLVKNIVRLNTIVRQEEGNPNQKLIELARNDVRDKTDTCIAYLKEIGVDINGDEGFHYFDDKTQFYPTIEEKYHDSEYPFNPNIIRTLCWTNNAVGLVNNYIRNKISESKRQIDVGDMLFGYKTINKELNSPPWISPIVKNAVTYKVTRVDEAEKKIEGKVYKGFIVRVENQTEPMWILSRESYDDFHEEINIRHYKGVNLKQWKSYYTLKEPIQVMDTFYNAEGKAICDKDVSFAYAITVHKSQGNTFDNTAILLGDILNNPIAQERRQLIYVAFSRTKKMNYILQQPKRKYYG